MIVENFFKRCSKCLNYELSSPRMQIGTCTRTFQVLESNTICPCPKHFIERPTERKEDKAMIEFGDLLPLIRCEFVVMYKNEKYYSDGNTIHSILKDHFKDCEVISIGNYFADEYVLTITIK